MHLANEVPPQGSTGGNHLSDYALTADLLAERTLDGLLAEHPGELIRTGRKSYLLKTNIYYNVEIIILYMIIFLSYFYYAQKNKCG